MLNCRTWIVCAAVAVLHAPSASAAEPVAGRDVQALAARIDHHIAAGCKAAQVEPVPLADDAEFLRRVYLDLAGRVPTVAEARAFQREQATDKRRQQVERLLDDRRYVTHFTNVWRAPDARAALVQARWCPNSNRATGPNAGYDSGARPATVPIRPNDNMQAFGNGQMTTPPHSIFLAKGKPETRASTSRLFSASGSTLTFTCSLPGASSSEPGGLFCGIQRQLRRLLHARQRTRKSTDDSRTERSYRRPFSTAKNRVSKQTSPRTTLAEWLTAWNNPYAPAASIVCGLFSAWADHRR